MDENEWNAYKQRSKTWRCFFDFDELHSEAFKKLTYAPALKVFCWFREKVKMKKNKCNRGRSRYDVLDGNISFLYEEARFRGLSSHQFSKALRELHKFGFIDVEKPDSRLKNDFTLYSMSKRWRDFGTPNFREISYPTSVLWVNFGFGSKEKESGKKYGKRKFAKC